MNDRPVLRRQNAPEHRPGFWDDLDAAMAAPAAQDSSADHEVSLRPVTPTGRVASAPHAAGDRRRSRRMWPLVAAAAALALAGLGMLFVRGADDPGTEVVSGSDGGDVAVADAPPAGEGADAGADADATAREETSPIPTAAADADTTEPSDAGVAPTPLEAEPASESIDLDALDVPTYVTAAGNRDTLMFPPATPFADGTRFLGTWEDERVSWFSLADIEADCTRPDHSMLRYVDARGFDFDVTDPAARFAGNASNFAFTDQHLAWVAECEGRLMLYVASQSGVAGQMFGPRLAWIGRGSDTAALVSWSGSVAQLSSIDDAGEPFFVEVDMLSQTVGGSAVRSDVGAGTGRDSWIVGVNPDGTTTWWNATQPGGSSTCDGRTLTRHTEAGGWESPFVDPIDVGEVQALAVNPELSMVAFSDACPGINEGRFFIGTLRADGLISSVRTIDLSAFASGSVFILDWTDPLSLRIHTDESVTGGFPLRFEYVFDDGRDAGVLVLLD